jgi:hypothetical protein
MWKKAFFFLSFLFLVGLSYKFYLGSYINSKLCLNKPVKDADLLIVEGWLEDEELKKASELFTSDKYKYIVTTGVLDSQFFKMGAAIYQQATINYRLRPLAQWPEEKAVYFQPG